MRAFTLIAAVLAAAGVAVAQAPSPTPCPWQCPETDNDYIDLYSSAPGPYDTIVCTYGSDYGGTCTYSTKDGVLAGDEDGGNCPYYGDKPCVSKRFNIVREIAQRRAAKPAPSVPEAVAKRAALKKRTA
ncbi:hypothetical protein AURDEDRAFT_165371 [Auricularia subglabra TFB-10046 SS5]|nr:hypothetical protein AURDEDRAFT_165371 [Auricularia subglabra TFB-10046 SS5]